MPVVPPGTADVVVTNAHGKSTLADAFTCYAWPPVFSSDARHLDADPPMAHASVSPRICCDGRHAWVVWFDKRNGKHDVYLNRSEDGGMSWLTEDVRLNTNGAGASESWGPQICCHGTYVFVVWADDRQGEHDVYLAASRDGGATWTSSDIRLDTDTPGSVPSRQPQICSDGARVYVTWYDDSLSGSDVYATASRPQP